MLKKYMLTACVASFLFATPAMAMDKEDAQILLDTKVSEWLSNPIVIDAIVAQNEKYAALTPDEVTALDDKWRAGDSELIDTTLNNELSKYLSTIVEGGEGLYSELFIMDAKGLNVGQSAKTSDYWQGDEAKWQKTYLVGAGAIDLGEVEFDESSQTYQIQISVPVLKGSEVIGAATIGVDAEMVE